MTGITFLLKDKVIFFSVLYFIFISANAQFEPVPVVKSSEKVVNQGKVFLLHTVKKGQTLYSICKAYQVSQNDIVLANPGVKLDVLSEGLVLKIPSSIQQTIITSSDQKETNREFYYHTLQPKQTIFYLHQKYNVPVDLIYKYNPGVEQGVQVGQVIKIPKNGETIDTTAVPASSSPEILGNSYTFKEGDSLYIIANTFGIPEADIINNNPALRWGMKPGQTIIIPYKPSNGLSDKGFAYDTLAQSYVLPGFDATMCDSISHLLHKEPVKVALMLPFYASDMYIVDTTQYNDSTDDGTTKPSAFRGRGAAEFYEGFLLAVDTLKQQGISIQIYNYDTEADTNKVKTILKELDKIKPSLIIGPFTPDNVRLVSNFSQKNGIPFVPPLMNEDETVKKNPYLYQVNPSLQSEIIASVNYLSQYYNQNIILAYKPGYTEQSNIDLFKKLLREKSLQKLTKDTLCFQEVILDEGFYKNMTKYLIKEKKNIFILLTNNEPYVSNILSQLYFGSKRFDIEVFGLPQWQKFSNVSIEHMHGLQVTMFSPYFIDYSSENTKNFILKCRNQLGFEPYKTSIKGSGMNYSFLGYDIGNYFIKAVYLFGNYTTQCSSSYKSDPLLISDYTFDRTSSLGCIENTSVNIIRYNKDFSLVKMKSQELLH